MEIKNKSLLSGAVLFSMMGSMQIANGMNEIRNNDDLIRSHNFGGMVNYDKEAREQRRTVVIDAMQNEVGRLGDLYKKTTNLNQKKELELRKIMLVSEIGDLMNPKDKMNGVCKVQKEAAFTLNKKKVEYTMTKRARFALNEPKIQQNSAFVVNNPLENLNGDAEGQNLHEASWKTTVKQGAVAAARAVYKVVSNFKRFAAPKIATALRVAGREIRAAYTYATPKVASGLSVAWNALSGWF